MTTHTVVSGDTLSHLALQYYGDALLWPRIYSANQGTILKAQNFGAARRALRAGGPPENWIFPGTVLTIPELTEGEGN